MPTAQEQLLSMMNPQQARLLDQQLANRDIAQQAQGAGMLSGLVQAGLRGANTIGNVFGTTPMGANEQAAIKGQQTQQQMMDAISGAQGADRIAKLRDTAARLRATGNYQALIKADQYDQMADQLEYKQDDLNIKKTQLLLSQQKPKSSGFASTEGEHFEDEQGNQYATVLVTNKDTGTSEVNYIPLGNAPEFSGQPLKAIIKSGQYAGMDPMSAAELAGEKAGQIELQKEFMKIKVEGAQNYQTAKSTYSELVKALELTKQAYEAGELEGGIQAPLQQLYYNVFGKRPKTVGELNLIFNETTFQRLKPLFGGNISNGEREAVADTYTSVYKNGKVNIGILEQLIAKANGAMFNYNVLMTSDNYDDYVNKLQKEQPKPTRKRRYNPETGKFEDVTE
jgi:hypothetical protein